MRLVTSFRHFAAVLVSSLAFSAFALAAATDGGTGIYTSYNRFWGNQAARDGIATCDFDALENTNDGGFVNEGNALFCRLKNTLKITGPTSAEGVTGSYTNLNSSSATYYLHAVVSGAEGGAAYNGFDYLAEVWGCTDGVSSGTACTTTADFSRLARFMWTKTGSAGEVNKGKLVMGNAYVITWDLGKSTASRYLEAKIVVAGNVSWYGKNTSTDTLIESTFIQVYVGSGGPMSFRWRQNFDLATGDVGYARVGPVMNATDTLKNDAPSYRCATRVKMDVDWDYTMVNGGSCSAVSVPTYPSYSIADVASWTPNSSIGYDWGTMTAQPANL